MAEPADDKNSEHDARSGFAAGNFVSPNALAPGAGMGFGTPKESDAPEIGAGKIESAPPSGLESGPERKSFRRRNTS